MRYCDLLLHHIMILEDGMAPCCPPVQPIYKSPLYKFCEPLDMDNYFEYIADFLKQMQEDNTLCGTCNHLKYEDVSFYELLKSIEIRTVSLNANKMLCNIRCSYCYLSNFENKKNIYFNYEKVLDKIFASPLSDIKAVNWVQGESTLYKDFPTLSRRFNSMGLYQNFLTNATIVSDEIIESMASGRGSLVISIDSGSREIFHKIKGADKFYSVLNTLHYYSKSLPNSEALILKYIITKDNALLPELIKFLIICSAFNACCFVQLDTYYAWAHEEIDSGAMNETTTHLRGVWEKGLSQQETELVPLHQWAGLKAQADQVAKALHLKDAAIKVFPPPRWLEDEMVGFDVENESRSHGYACFDEFFFPLLAECAQEVHSCIEFDHWGTFAGWVLNGEKGVFLADINTESAFGAGLAQIQADYGRKACVYEPYKCTCIPIPGLMDCQLEEYYFRLMCLYWGHIFSREEMEQLRVGTESVYLLGKTIEAALPEKRRKDTDALLERVKGKNVYFWGCGEAYKAYKHLFSATRPKAVILDPEYIGDGLQDVDGIRVVSSASIGFQESDVPTIIFVKKEYAKVLAHKAEALFNKAHLLCL